MKSLLYRFICDICHEEDHFYSCSSAKKHGWLVGRNQDACSDCLDDLGEREATRLARVHRARSG